MGCMAVGRKVLFRYADIEGDCVFAIDKKPHGIYMKVYVTLRLFYIFHKSIEEGLTMKAIEAEGSSKNFRVKHKEKGMRGSIQSIFHPQTEEICAVDSVSFGVEEGEILAFIGPNGAGKSTTIKMLTGILYPDSGHVEVLGIDPVRKRRQLAYQIGTVFGQKEQLWTHLTPNDNFRFFGAIYDLDNDAA